jgi:predicted nuclease of predicted toxin-antitoxin system
MVPGLYMDVHIPSAISDALRRRGLDVLTSQDDGFATLDDEALLARATSLGRVLMTQDHDFLRISADWQHQGRPFVGIRFARLVGVSLGIVIDDAQIALECSDPDQLHDRITYLPFG